MELNTFIEVQAFGDFDIKYTDCVMVHCEKMDKNEILEEFYQVQGITSNKGLDYRPQFTSKIIYLIINRRITYNDW